MILLSMYGATPQCIANQWSRLEGRERSHQILVGFCRASIAERYEQVYLSAKTMHIPKVTVRTRVASSRSREQRLDLPPANVQIVLNRRRANIPF